MAWKSMKELAGTEDTMNMKYWRRFLPRPLSTRARLLNRLVWKGVHLHWQICWQRSFGIRKTTLRLEVDSYWHRKWGLAVSRVKSRALKMVVFVCTLHISSLYCKFTRLKVFREFNFHSRKYFKTKLFLIYGNTDLTWSAWGTKHLCIPSRK